MRRLRRQEEPTNHERWAIPYGDLLTLLLAFFVVMYSVSSVNAGKYRVLSNSLYAAFRGQPRTAVPIPVGRNIPGDGAGIPENSDPRRLVRQPAVARRAPPHGAALESDPTLGQLAVGVANAMRALMRAHVVELSRKPGMLEVRFRSDILFPSGSARLARPAVTAIRRLAGVLRTVPNPVRVEGFTDNVPIHTVQFASNWELSAARAGSVVHVLSVHGVAPRRLAVIGFGAQQPIASNATAAGRAENRRVVVVILAAKLGRHADPAWLPGAGP
jgi:chemotaxis protein MotB